MSHLSARSRVTARSGTRLVFALRAMVTASMIWVAAVAVAGEPLRLKVATFDPLEGTPTLRGELAWDDAAPEAGVFVVQFDRPIDPGLLDSVRSRDVELLGYVPENAYLVRLAPGAAERLSARGDVRWLGAVEPGWKLAPDLGTRPYVDASRREGGKLYATADLFPGADADGTVNAVVATGAEVLQVVRFASRTRLKLHAPLAGLQRVARIGAIAYIEEAAEITSRNETTKWVIQENVPDTTPVWDHGLRGQGQVIGHIDNRLDMNSCWIRDDVDNAPGPGHRKVLAYRSSNGIGSSSHGTHTAATAAGDQFAVNGTTLHNGTAYEAKLTHGNSGDVSGSRTNPSNLYDFLADAHADGARVHTNSWGDDGTTSYTTWSQDIDRFSYDFEDSLVLFAVTNGSVLRTPENAKNVLAVGASSNGTAAGNHCSGGRGPTNDGRRKPEIYAPGCSIVSARNSTDCSTRSSTGTSMACPAVTGAGALVRQYFEEGYYPSGAAVAEDARVPSAALVKATLLNATVDMTGVAGYPSETEGWGRVLLENALMFAGDLRRLSVLEDLRNADGLSTGESREFTLEVEDAAEPLKISAVWTEPPAELLAAAATINDLDLEVVAPSGTLYRGNDIDPATGLSTTGGAPDAINNVEMVIVASPEIGDWTVRLVGAAVNQDTQGFAVVASGGVVPFSAGPLRYAGHVVDDSSGGNGDGIVDPGETIALPWSLRNAGNDAITGIGANLAASDRDALRMTSPSGTFPDLAPDGSAQSNAPHFGFVVQPDVACGTTVRIDAELASSAGAGATGFSIAVGKTTTDGSPATLPVGLAKKSSTPVTSTADVSDAFTIREVDVEVEITHEDISELVITLTSPTGTVVTLHDGSGAGVANLSGTYDESLQPDGPGTMGDFAGEPGQGTWTLSVTDNVGGPAKAGEIVSWRVILEATTPISCNPRSCGEPAPAEAVTGLRLASEGSADVRFDWAPLGGASGYRVWRAGNPELVGEAPVGETSATTLVEVGTLGEPGIAFYVVRAKNVCDWEGP